MKHIFNRRNFGAILFFIVGLGFFVIAMIATVPEIKENSKREKILESGERVTAEITEKHAAGTIDDVEYYNILFKYVNADGETLEGKTSPSYTLTDIMNMSLKGQTTIEVVYNEDGAVEADFDRVQANKKYKTLLLIFGGVGLVSLVAGVTLIVIRTIREVKVDKSVTVVQGEVLGHICDLIVNGKRFYAIKVLFANDEREMIEGKTECIYTQEEIEKYPAGSKVMVKYYRNKVEIVTEEAENG